MPDRPNFLVFITHDSGRHFGCYGAGVHTPHVDALAAQGARFARNYCAAPQCSPARASLITSRMPVNHGLVGLVHRGFRLKPPSEAPRLPGILAQAGYRTWLFGMQHEAPDSSDLGYAYAPGVSSRSLVNVIPVFHEFIRKGLGTPFFVCIGVGESHRPFPGAYAPDDPATVTVPPWLPDTPEVRRDVADLNAKIRAIDRGVAETVEALNRAGLAENTVLVFTTDHGIAFPRSKATLFEPGVGTAMIARGPGLPAGRVVDRLTSHMDLMPTFLEMAGVEPPQGIEGRSLMPLLYDPATPWRDALFLEMTFHSAYDPMRGCVTDRYKYVRSYETDKFMLPANVDQGPTKGVFLARGEHLRPRPAEMLFDLLEDPTENENLACCPSSEDVLAHMRRRVDAWLRDRDDPILDGSYPQPAGTSVTPRDSLVPNPAA